MEQECWGLRVVVIGDGFAEVLAVVDVAGVEVVVLYDGLVGARRQGTSQGWVVVAVELVAVVLMNFGCLWSVALGVGKKICCWLALPRAGRLSTVHVVS